MVSSKSLILGAVAFLSIAEAAPVEPRSKIQKRGFTLEQVSNGNFRRNGTHTLVKAYRKFGVSMPAELAASVTDEEGSVIATPEENDVEFLIPVTVGGQPLNLDLDTGSSDLWVFSTSLTRSDQDGHSVYDPTNSTTFQEIQGASWEISYGDGSGATGTVGTDTVEIGGVTATAQAVEVATDVSDEFVQDVATDGLIGMAFSTLNTVKPEKQKTFFDNVKDSLDEPLFTADLKKDAPGAYEFGFVNSSRFTGDIKYVAVDSSNGFWGFSAEGFTIGTGDAQTLAINGIVDTGSTLLMLPSDLVVAYYDTIKSTQYSAQLGGFVFDCSETPPDLTISIDGFAATVSGENMNYAEVDQAGTTCYGGLQSDDGIGFSIFGDIFLKSIFTVFNGGNNTLGFAAKP